MPSLELSRRRFLSTAAALPLPAMAASLPAGAQETAAHGGHGQGGNIVVGEVDHAKNGFDPHAILTDWDAGALTTDAAGRRTREWTLTAVDHEFEVAPGVTFAGWSYNGRIPGPTLRCTEGERLRIRLINASSHPHSMHFHGIHAARMDGVPGAGLVEPGGEFIYEFDARPFGCHHYHCHAIPLKRHIHKGLYGAFIIDPKEPRAPAQEFVLVMNGFDTDADGGNNFYTVNGRSFYYAKYPIRVSRSQTVRVYLANLTEFDLINSLHLHGDFFRYYRTGSTDRFEYTDTVMQCQGERGILEIEFANTGKFMFHAHQSEFAELGWMGFFDVVD